ncbi:MAG: hypothetical protein LBF78_11395 [Treponema sp.]|jgi:hypothetical protein|nr:hypothetical protein [Treponema sp.]
MTIRLVYRVFSPVILVVFTFVSCSSPFFSSKLPGNPVPAAEIASVPLGEGDPRFFYLDSNYQLSETNTDTGITALLVENNEMASGVLVLAEVPDNDLENGSVVRVINTNNNSLVSLFFYRGQKFPHKMLITQGGKTVNAKFSAYNPSTETFSLSLEYGDEHSAIEDITMNSKVLTLYHFQDDLTESQNVRMQNIIVSLAVWACLAIQIPGSDFTVNARGLTSFLRGLLVTIFAVVAVVAFTVAVILAGPAAISIAGPAVVIALETPAAAAWGLTSVLSAAAAVFVSKIPVDEIDVHETSAAVDPKPQVTIRKGGVEVPNGNWDSPYYLDLGAPPEAPPAGSSMTFDLQFYTSTGSIEPPLVGKFDPELQLYGDLAGTNNFFFSIDSAVEYDVLKITVKRAATPGYIGTGRMRLIIKFNQDFVINSSSAGVDFQDQGETEARNRKDIFILDFTVIAPGP